MKASSRCKFFAVIAAVMSLVIFAMPLLAQNDFETGRMAGSQAARVNTNGTVWLAIGCLGGIIGIAIAYVVEPNPPAMSLLGKSPEYVAAYTDAYKMTAKGIQTGSAWKGCIVGTLAYIALGVLAAAADESID